MRDRCQVPFICPKGAGFKRAVAAYVTVAELKSRRCARYGRDAWWHVILLQKPLELPVNEML